MKSKNEQLSMVEIIGGGVGSWIDDSNKNICHLCMIGAISLKKLYLCGISEH